MTDERTLDAKQKTEELQRLRREGSFEDLHLAVEKAKIALDARKADAMIGLEPIDQETLTWLSMETDSGVTRLAELSLEAGKGGNAEAAVYFADWIWKTRQEDKVPQAIELATMAQSKDPTGAAAYYLGLFAFNGLGQEVDLDKSYRLHLEAAERGHADAMFELYAMTAKGQGCDADEGKATEWCVKSAEGGNVRAMANVGGFYAMGRGVPQDDALAFEWYEKAANQGHGRAATVCGIFAYQGKGVEADSKRAESFFQTAADIGFFAWESLAEMQGIPVAELNVRKPY